MSTVTEQSPVETEADVFLSGRRGAIAAGVTQAQLKKLAEQGYIEMRIGVGGIAPKYSRRSCVALRKQMIRPATRMVEDIPRS
jgi:hypothetical protein